MANGTTEVSRKKGKGAPYESEGVENETVPETAPPDGSGKKAVVKYGLGVTLNMGNYEFIRVDAGLEMPCAPTAKGITKTYDVTKRWVETKLEEKTDELK